MRGSSRVWQAIVLFGVALWCGELSAQATPVGLWRSVDDATGKTKALVRIVETGGVLSGTIEQLFDQDPTWDGRCDHCRDHRKDQPVVGMTILTNLRRQGGEYGGG